MLVPQPDDYSSHLRDIIRKVTFLQIVLNMLQLIHAQHLACGIEFQVDIDHDQGLLNSVDNDAAHKGASPQFGWKWHRSSRFATRYLREGYHRNNFVRFALVKLGSRRVGRSVGRSTCDRVIIWTCLFPTGLPNDSFSQVW